MRLNPRIFALVFSVVLALYSTQPYLPTSIKHSHSVSYSVLHCPSHSPIHNSLSYVIHHVGKSENEEGTEKYCFCFSCCLQRSLFTIFRPSINVLVDRYITYLFPLDESIYLKHFYTNLSVRSPPIFSS
jgi:hypothetical protein